MPSSATTNVTIGTLLDLIGPTASGPSADRDQPAFDSLLQPPPSPTPAPPSPPPATDEHTASPRRTADSSDRTDTHPPPVTATANTENSPNNQSDSQQETGAKAAPSAQTASTKQDGVASDSEQQSVAADPVLAESLAGLAAVVPVAPIVNESSSAEGTTEPNGLETAEDKDTVGNKIVTRPQMSAAQVALAKPAVEGMPKEQPQASAASSTKAVQHPDLQNTHAPHSADKTTAANLENGDPTSQKAVLTAFDGQTDAVNGELPAADATQQPERPQPHQAQPSVDPQAIKLDPTAASAPAIDPTQAAGGSAPPPVAAVATSLPSVEPARTANGSTPPNGVLGSAPAERSRLPAEVLAQPMSGPSRRTSVEVDATRLLTRVARAFTAAQERDGEIRLRLSPPELGSLRLEIRVQDGALVARVQTETDAARTAILDNLPALRDRLLEQGVRIERFDVDLMQRQPGGMPDQPGGRQQDFPTGPPRVIPSPRPRMETAASIVPSSPAVGSADGLNVIV